MELTEREIDEIIEDLKYLQESTGYNSYIKNKIETIINKLKK